MFLVRHTVFMKKQPFLEFVCEIMLHSPRGKRIYGRQRNVAKATGDDVLGFLDIHNPTYRIEAEFLLKHCKRKCWHFSLQENRVFCTIRPSCSIERCEQTHRL